MIHPFLFKLNEKNLCTWYLLPLIGINVEYFGTANHINTFIVENERKIVVEVADLNLCQHVQKHPDFLEYRTVDNREFLVYDIPEMWDRDFKYFLSGKYSRFSENAKTLIRDLSTLAYDVVDEYGNRKTDAILMALDKNDVLREKWYEILGPVELPEELLSIPLESSFLRLQE